MHRFALRYVLSLDELSKNESEKRTFHSDDIVLTGCAVRVSIAFKSSCCLSEVEPATSLSRILTPIANKELIYGYD